MSAEAAIGAVEAPGVRTLRVLRYAVGSTVGMAIAMSFAWALSYLTPVLALSFLGTPTPRPSLREGIGFLAIVVVSVLAGLTLARHALPYPAVYLPLVALILLRLFHWKESGGHPLVITWMMIALLAIPMIAMQSPGLARLVGLGLVFGAGVTVAIVWLVYGLFPDPPGLFAGQDAASATTPALAAPGERRRNALLSTLVVFPLLVLFHLFEWTGGLLVLIFVALLSLQPAFAKSFKVGAAMILGNSIGGLAAILAYELLVMVPLFGMLLLLTLLAGLLFGKRLFSGDEKAALFGMAYSTLLLILGSTTTSDSAAGAKVYTRVAQIFVAVVYVVTAFGLVDRLLRRRGV